MMIPEVPPVNRIALRNYSINWFLIQKREMDGCAERRFLKNALAWFSQVALQADRNMQGYVLTDGERFNAGQPVLTRSSSGIWVITNLLLPVLSSRRNKYCQIRKLSSRQSTVSDGSRKCPKALMRDICPPLRITRTSGDMLRTLQNGYGHEQ
jgi:hypothetical protein